MTFATFKTPTTPQQTPLRLSDLSPAQRRALAGPGLRTFFKIAEAWRLSQKEQMALLGVSRSTLDNYRKQPGAVSLDTLERLSYLIGIYKALHILLPDPAAADAWVKQPNTAPLFGGRRAIERMTSGRVADLHAVREYLDAERGGAYD